MLIATFGPTTAWQGRNIDFDGSSFVLQGHGPIMAADVLTYESQGLLLWASPEARSLAWSRAQSPPGSSPAAYARPVQARAGTGTVAARSGRRLWPIVVVVAAIMAVVAVVAPLTVGIRSGNHPDSKEAEVKIGVHMIQTGVRSYAVDHNNTYPPRGTVTSGALVDAGGRPCVDGWPTNPYTLAPMAAGNGPGDYEYSRTANGFEITAFGAAGQPIITVP